MQKNPEQLIQSFQARNVTRKLKQARIYRVHDNLVQRFYKEEWMPVCQHDELIAFDNCQQCEDLVTLPSLLIPLFKKRNLKRRKMQTERVYRISENGLSVERLYKDLWEPVCKHDELLRFNTCGACNPVPVKSGCSHVACKFIDRLQSELGFKIQHAHFNQKLGVVEGTEHKPFGNIRVDGFYVDSNGTNVAIEFLGDIWHGHPSLWGKTIKRFKGIKKRNFNFEELFSKTEQRFRLLVQNGFHVIYIWERMFHKVRIDQSLLSHCITFNGFLEPRPEKLQTGQEIEEIEEIEETEDEHPPKDKEEDGVYHETQPSQTAD